MSREEKKRIIGEIEEILSGCSAAVFTDYRGLSAGEITELRRKLRGANVNYRVVKNTMARFAAEAAGKPYLTELIEGPVAIAYSSGEVSVSAQVLTEYIISAKLELSIKGGFIGDKMLTKAEVAALAKLPSREVLVAQVLAGMQSPITSLVSCLSSPMRGLAGVLSARIKQLEGE
ncbi:MAG: 50S ribosomal protein L10 [Dehalococcoidales bacterium]|jgi:large subunit ribosomal protein L10